MDLTFVSVSVFKAVFDSTSWTSLFFVDFVAELRVSLDAEYVGTKYAGEKDICALYPLLAVA